MIGVLKEAIMTKGDENRNLFESTDSEAVYRVARVMNDGAVVRVLRRETAVGRCPWLSTGQVDHDVPGHIMWD